MKHLFAIAVFLLAACSWSVGDTASDERELTQLVNDLNAVFVRKDGRWQLVHSQGTTIKKP